MIYTTPDTTQQGAFVSAHRDDGALHANRDCHALDSAVVVDEVKRSDHAHRKRCSYCHGTPADRGDVPRMVPCPCNNGYAERPDRPATTEVQGQDRERVERHYHYRHSGCPLGGTVVTVNGEVRRRSGPLFQPERYRVTPRRARAEGRAD